MSQNFSDETVAAARQADDLPDFAESTPLPEVDRSDAERYAVCPAQARFIETGRVTTTSHAMEVGSEVHDALSAGIEEYLQADLELRPWQIAEMVADVVRGRLMNARPDLQPDAIVAAMPMLYPWSRFIASLAPENILRFDGGRGNRSGQIGVDIPSLGICATSELDLLYAGPSPSVLHELDYKSGRTNWSESKVASEFQFTYHAWLVFNEYDESVEALDVSVWPTREREPTKPVRFERKYLAEYEARVMQTLLARERNKNLPPERAEVWPTVEKCPLCPARALCPGLPKSEIDADPAAYVFAMYALKQRLDGMEEIATAYRDRTGTDIVAQGGIVFGRNKPAAKRSNPAVFYELKH